MSLGTALTSTGRVLSSLPWKEIGSGFAQLAPAAGFVFLDAKKGSFGAAAPRGRDGTPDAVDESV